MSSILGSNADRWMGMITSFIGDPSKYGLSEQIFNLPDIPEKNIEGYLQVAESKWNKINPKDQNPYKNLDESVPFWMVFTLSKRPATLFLAVWDEVLEARDREMYQDLHYNFQELIQNFIREELGLFKIVRPFRSRTGNSVLGYKQVIDKELDDTISDQLSQFTSPQKILHNIAYFVKNNTIQAGIAYILVIERFSALISKTRNTNQIKKVTRKFLKEINRLNQANFAQTPPSQTQVEGTIEIPETKIIEFEKVVLQEYDGYVEIRGFCEEEQRNFRIYNCVEEDLLREEIWKGRHYPIRRLIDTILDDRYSRPTKEYSLKYGVDIEILDPNWSS